MDPDEEVTISRADVAALIGLAAIVKDFARVGDLSPVVQAKIQRRLARDLDVDDTAPLPQLLDELTKRLHQALDSA